MSYFFTNPQVKKWKTLFTLSMLLNLVLIAAIVVGRAEQASQGAVSDKHQEKKAEKSSDLPVEKEPKKEVPKVKAGDNLVVSMEIVDNFYSSFSNSSSLARYANLLNIPNLDELLSAHVARLLMWDMVLRKDVRNGDQCRVIFRAIPAEEKKQRNDLPDDIEVIAVQYDSKKFAKTFAVNLYDDKKHSYPRYYYANGKMIEPLFKNAPVKDYIQLTAKLHDRLPKHDGIDFKAVVGTEVFSPFSGVVTRTNWKTRYNGYCVEIKVKGKREVLKFLHLSDVLVKRGDKVKAGDVIARSGNTGKTTAPHLHYQINRGRRGRVVDPLLYHDTFHYFIEDNEKEKFKEHISSLNKLYEKK